MIAESRNKNINTRSRVKNCLFSEINNLDYFDEKNLLSVKFCSVWNWWAFDHVKLVMYIIKSKKYDNCGTNIKKNGSSQVKLILCLIKITWIIHFLIHILKNIFEIFLVLYKHISIHIEWHFENACTVDTKQIII
jgi:hypothetical protein